MHPSSCPSAIEVELNYVAPMQVRPYMYTFDPPHGIDRTNLVFDRKVIPIRNARPFEFDFDQAGFSLLRHTSTVGDFFDPVEVRRVYYPETERLLTEATGADRAVVFDHTVRRRVRGAEDRKHPFRQPVELVHVDYSAFSAPRRVRDLLDEVRLPAAGRIQIINVWRSLQNALRDTPLGVCEASSVAPADYVPADLIYASGPREVLLFTYNPKHRWFYFPAMNADEALIFKCYDSRSVSCAQFTPHSAFIDPTASGNSPTRESIEVRVLLAYHN